MEHNPAARRGRRYDLSTHSNRWRSFAGVTLAQELKSLCDTSTEVVVVSRDNHLVFTPIAARSRGPFYLTFPCCGSRTSSYQTSPVDTSDTN
jgi:hypothetical protein